METPITDMIPRYHEPEPETGTRMTNTFRCEVKKTSHCRSVTVLYCTVLYCTVLQVRHQARLQEDHVERVQVKTTSPHLCHVLECNDVDTLLMCIFNQ